MRVAILATALAFALLLAGMTLWVLFTTGPDVLVAVSLVVLVVFTFGIAGALTGGRRT